MDSFPTLSADSKINLFQKPVKPSVYGLFDFLDLSFFAVLYRYSSE
jgi:hypothetical protein